MRHRSPTDGPASGRGPDQDTEIAPNSQESSELSPVEEFEEILRLHRQGAPAQEVHFQGNLCFPLGQTADPTGLRYVLWYPVALFLKFGFEIEIEEQLCEGQVALAYMGHEAATFASKITPQIERVRRKYPMWVVSSGPQVLVHVLTHLSESLLWHDQGTAEKIQRMTMEFKSAVRRGDYSGLSALRAQLSELAGSSSESDVRVCVDYLRNAMEETGSRIPTATLASERVLARDWLTPEEDVAWSHL
ncbi:MAG TPA: hypothetical protein VGN17_24805 [Bryobacteraceae bacterium]|jgi:hypothetical protein